MFDSPSFKIAKRIVSSRYLENRSVLRWMFKVTHNSNLSFINYFLSFCFISFFLVYTTIVNPDGLFGIGGSINLITAVFTVTIAFYIVDRFRNVGVYIYCLSLRYSKQRIDNTLNSYEYHLINDLEPYHSIDVLPEEKYQKLMSDVEIDDTSLFAEIKMLHSNIHFSKNRNYEDILTPENKLTLFNTPLTIEE